MKILKTFLIINGYNPDGSFTILKAYKTNIGWYKEVKLKRFIHLEKTTREEILLLSEKLSRLMKEQT